MAAVSGVAEGATSTAAGEVGVASGLDGADLNGLSADTAVLVFSAADRNLFAYRDIAG